MISLAEALKFVKGSLAKKDFVPVLTCLRFQPGRVTGFNGVMSLSTPVPTRFAALVPGGAMLVAANACEGAVTVTKDEVKVTIGSGRVFVHVPVVSEDEEYPVFGPCDASSSAARLTGPLLPMLRKAAGFMSEDASKPWTCGVSMKSGCFTATNNVILFCGAAGIAECGDIILPAEAVRELLRIGEEPVAIRFDERKVTFFYVDERWLVTKRLDNNWPTSIADLLSTVGTAPELPASFFQAVETARKFVCEAGYLYVREGYLCTSAQPDKKGASISVPGLTADACFHVDQLLKLADVATAIDFAAYPKPCSFTGEDCGGLLVGMRSAEEVQDGPSF